MLKPFYQGKLDTFCAIYAVLNALRLTHGIRVLKARDILNETLLGLARQPEALAAVLTQETDYMALVDSMLRVQSRALLLEVHAPFRAADGSPVAATPDEFWRACQEWLAPCRGSQTAPKDHPAQPGRSGKPGREDKAQGRAIIFRFLRHLTPEGGPVNRHWTTADSVSDEVLHLFDCSHEAEAILNIRRGSFVTRPEQVSRERLLHIQPESARFVRLPF